jgi:response regulator of citrate/malate metabolism
MSTVSLRWITVTEVARRLDISRPTARKRLLAKQIAGLTSHYGYGRIDRKVFEEWLVSEGSGKGGKPGNLTKA